jgi:hypothetical protein
MSIICVSSLYLVVLLTYLAFDRLGLPAQQQYTGKHISTKKTPAKKLKNIVIRTVVFSNLSVVMLVISQKLAQ